MATGFLVNGTDLDSIFAPIRTGWTQTTVTEFKVGVNDLSTRYAKLSYGSAAGATGYKVAGADLNTYFAAINTDGIRGSCIITDSGATVQNNPPVIEVMEGYNPGVVGAVSSQSFGTGISVNAFYTDATSVNNGSTYTYITYLKFNVPYDPGQSGFTQLTSSKGTLTSASATYNGWASGIASWQWAVAYWGGSGSNVTVTFT